MAEIKTESQSRQGPKGKPVLYVLIGSLALLAIYMIGMMTWSGTTSPPTPADRSQQAARETATGANKPANSGGAAEPGGNPSNPAPAQPNAR